MPPVLTKNDDVLELALSSCRGSEFQDAKEKVREIPGRRWDPQSKNWLVPATPENADQILKTIRPECDDETMAWLKGQMVEHEESLTTPLPDDDSSLLLPWAYKRASWQPDVINDVTFSGALDYQRAAIGALAKWQRGLLCDDMGLGKTFEAISTVEEYILRNVLADQVTCPSGPRLVIAPASVLGGWDRELNRWLETANVQLVDSKNKDKRHDQIIQGILDDAWLVVNWEQIRVKKIDVKRQNGSKGKLTVMKEPLFQYPAAAEWDLKIDDWQPKDFGRAQRQFGAGGWLAVIADEVHRAKNKDAQQTQGLHRISGEIMLGLTGTPIMNSPDELWSLLAWLWPDEYHKQGKKHADGAVAYWDFYQDYVSYWEDHYGRKTVTGVKNPDALRFALKGKLIRLTESILGLEGRKRIYFDLPLKPKQQKLYDDAEKAMWLAINDDASAGNKDAIEMVRKAAAGATVTELMKIPNGAARFVRLQQIIESPALLGGPDESAAMDDFEQKFEDSGEQQWMVMCKYKGTCQILADRLRKKFDLEDEDGKSRVAIYTGDVSPRERTQIEDDYQRGQIRVVIGTIDALYQGITLTAGHMQYWMSRDVVPAKNEQGEARQDRQGQQKLVLVYIPQATNTVARDKVHVINRLKEGIVKTIIPQDEIQEKNG